MCLNCSLSFLMVSDPVESSVMNCLGLDKKVTRRIRFKVSAKFVPRCGVDRNTMDVTDLIILR